MTLPRNVSENPTYSSNGERILQRPKSSLIVLLQESKSQCRNNSYFEQSVVKRSGNNSTRQIFAPTQTLAQPEGNPTRNQKIEEEASTDKHEERDRPKELDSIEEAPEDSSTKYAWRVNESVNYARDIAIPQKDRLEGKRSETEIW